MIFEFLRGVTH